MPSSPAARAKINEKLLEMQRKSIPIRLQIDEKSILGRFGPPSPFRVRVRTRSGRLLDTQMLPQSRSWDTPGEPRAARSRPKASPGRPEDTPRHSRDEMLFLMASKITPDPENGSKMCSQRPSRPPGRLPMPRGRPKRGRGSVQRARGTLLRACWSEAACRKPAQLAQLKADHFEKAI